MLEKASILIDEYFNLSDSAHYQRKNILAAATLAIDISKLDVVDAIVLWTELEKLGKEREAEVAHLYSTLLSKNKNEAKIVSKSPTIKAKVFRDTTTMICLGKVCAPVSYENKEDTINSGYGEWRKLDFSKKKTSNIGGEWSQHKGIDFEGNMWELVRAVADGKVVEGYRSTTYGNRIVIDHGGGLETTYNHMTYLIKVVMGDIVKAGQVIGYIGSTGTRSLGPHLHFETRYFGEKIDPSLVFSLKPEFKLKAKIFQITRINGKVTMLAK
jgi:murein DD-endopeptidase MepM/ murein hydrolase activator NlpD